MTDSIKTDDHMDRLFPEYLEEVTGDQALTWVRGRNEQTERYLASDTTGQVTPSGKPIPTLKELEDQILEVLDDPERIPMVAVRGDLAYNFWTDADNPRGLWRRQPFESYLAGEDAWETLIDVDALSSSEGKSWVWHGASVLYPSYDRALITLSDGGSDADETREFDLETLDWVEDGFYRGEAKGSLGWIDRDHCWFSQPDGLDSTSSSGYPLEARVVSRGQSADEAELIFKGDASSMGVWAASGRDRTGQIQAIEEALDFYSSAQYFVSGGIESIKSGEFKRIPVPESAQASIWNQWTIVMLRDDWSRPEVGEEWPSGALLSLLTDEFLKNPDTAPATPMFLPTENEVLEGLAATATKVMVTSICDVVPRITALVPSDDGRSWHKEQFNTPPTGNPYVTIEVAAVTPLENDRLWVVTTGYIEPSTLWLVEEDGTWRQVRQAPSMYNADGVEVSQHFAESEDGTRIPYFQISKPQNGPAPTLLYGYGGFQVSLLPSYEPVTGRAWLEHGGVYVVANIRGGGEYGPEWHKAALQENRHRAYEDFAAVARDLVRRGVTTERMLGAEGGSNGGLLMGNMYTQYPEDFGAIVCSVPLLDMGRYHTLLAGASWIAEYGDPDDPEQWEFIRSFSPVHLFEAEREYPSLLLTTSTKDDRVHPAHARALGYLTEHADKDALYFENIEGGHGGAADSRQRAHNRALSWEFLWRKLTAN
ncbi:prolyl oligopeptidase family serine peptidase [Actinomycetaceae bacterium MB13-C1-2]|nr:prolyl oligopeptidase family serine peptidase [Actinomycetaceae bacterium MB13-C1-2]